MDDVIISSPLFTQHYEHLREVFRLLQDAGLTLNKDKCKFGSDELKYQSLIINEEGIKTDETKVRAIVEMKPRRNAKEVSKFLELSTLDKELESLIDIEKLEDEIVTREEYRDNFIIWKIRAERYVGTVLDIAIQNSVENQPQNITLPLNSTVSSVLSNQSRLPKLTLGSFSVKDIRSFPSFWARFKSAVHENSSLNDDKFSYLKSVVTSHA
ncbi:uncharacterized protein TNCV_2472791 [Trichonephila clavipes]|nr:uncharacterized protein TNCV_2472791 [Trichonephila clavipes]